MPSKIRKSRKVKKVIAGKPHVRIGKHGVTEGIINEIKSWLKREGVIKVRVLRSAATERDVEEIAEDVASRVDALVIDVRGNVFILARRKESRKPESRRKT